ncbi:MAG: DUF4468 domain-containing protein [Leptospiraceae bacterium]|nr:DUF4468 domain-containing protein [Leptospiraceae bacterium]
MKNIFITYIFIYFVLIGCKSLGPKEIRHAEIIENTGVSASTAYSRANVFLAKVYGDSNSAIKVNDDKNKRIVGKMRILNCFSNITVESDLDFQAKDKRVRIAFEDIQAFTVNMQTGQKAYEWGPSDSKDVEEIKEKCLIPNVVKPLLSSINKKEKSW